jgi:hypothetical protein
LKAINKKINKPKEIAILKVSAFMVRLVLPESRIRKIKPLNKELAINNMTIMMKILVIICYTSALELFVE